jgi:hypothetical protein
MISVRPCKHYAAPQHLFPATQAGVALSSSSVGRVFQRRNLVRCDEPERESNICPELLRVVFKTASRDRREMYRSLLTFQDFAGLIRNNKTSILRETRV